MSSSPIMFALILLISRLFEQVGRGRGVVEWNTLSHVPVFAFKSYSLSEQTSNYHFA